MSDATSEFNRRKFLILSGASLATGIGGYLFGSHLNRRADEIMKENNIFTNGIYNEKISFPISVVDGPDRMHAFRNYFGNQSTSSSALAIDKELKTQTLIVGAGISGLSAAVTLGTPDFLLCETSDRIGGTASSYTLGQHRLATGAHYTIEYPKSFGNEVTGFLAELNIIHYNTMLGRWEFVDKQHLIDEKQMQQVYINHQLTPELPIAKADIDKLIKLFERNYGQFNLPTTKNTQEIKKLDLVSFSKYLESEIGKLSEETITAINYRMRDDYGANFDKVSALAGMTHYAGRDASNTVYRTFSPPEGNAYFAKKMADKVVTDNLLLSHSVIKIENNDNGYQTTVLDIENKKLKKISSKKIIYAGSKHGLKYTKPDQYSLFKDVEYSPWVVIGFLLDGELEKESFWQNEMLGEDDNFIGFVNSKVQTADNNNKEFCLTVYFCLPPEERYILMDIAKDPKFYIRNAIYLVSTVLRQNINPLIKEAFVRPIGHGIAIPKVKHTSIDKNKTRKEKNLVFAGVDNARLPLIFEALDSGINSARLINE